MNFFASDWMVMVVSLISYPIKEHLICQIPADTFLILKLPVESVAVRMFKVLSVLLFAITLAYSIGFLLDLRMTFPTSSIFLLCENKRKGEMPSAVINNLTMFLFEANLFIDSVSIL